MMTGLLGPDGRTPLDQWAARGRGRPANPKPIVGNIDAWGSDISHMQLPGGGTLQFDTSKLTLGDFRRMSENYQIGSSLRVLTFMMHQIEWTIKGGTPKSRAHCEENLRKVWTPLVRAMAQSFKLGFTACAVEWENQNGKTVINKFKDLVQEDVDVHWRYEEAAPIPGELPGAIRPKVKIFDGIQQFGKKAIPASNSFWYPLLMENGNYGGTKLLRAAFQPYFFSNLVHLFRNRYTERFGEPVPIGRAPYDEDIEVSPGVTKPGNQVMRDILGALRSRSAVVLPNQRTQDGLGGVKSFDYQIEYLESQMRGADFESYLTRLDEEMSLALFTPLLLLRTADGGGFNQGVGHTQVFLWMLNAIAGDWKEYIDRYILAPMVRYNPGLGSDIPTIHFRKMGTAQQETLRAVVQSLLGRDKIKVDVEELGAHIGLDIQEVEELEKPQEGADPDDLGEDGDNGNRDGRVTRPERIKNDDPKNVNDPKSTTKPITQRIAQRVKTQATKAIGKDGWSDFQPDLGYARQLASAFEACGESDGSALASAYEQRVLALVEDCVDTYDYAGSLDEFMKDFNKIQDVVMEKMLDG